MTFETDVRDAAHVAQNAVNATIEKYRSGQVIDEPDITGVLVGQLDARLNDNIGKIKWNSTIVRSASGSAAEEKKIGADLLINVQLSAYGRSYNKGVLVQSKRLETGLTLTSKEAERLHLQCRKMNKISASSFVFAYATTGIRCGGAASFYDQIKTDLYGHCPWTPFRFFWELFRCPIGDPRIKSSVVKGLPVPNRILLQAKGPGTE
jgi:hypothetical protein